ncbi:MAG: J domain-containing protein [Acidobacteriota bacterium]
MEDFTDYYELLQISPKAEPQTIQRVYRMLAVRYHPDNPATGDREMFLLLQKAYEVLTDPELRAAYDASHQIQFLQPDPVFEMKEFVVGVEAEANRRLGILCLLYNQRRSDPDRPTLSLLDLEARMAIPREHLEFTTWYLKEKCYLRYGDSGNLGITSEGVDYVESKVPSDGIVHRLLKGAVERTSPPPPSKKPAEDEAAL